MLQCQQCGEPCDRLHQGVCLDCCVANQNALDRHNAEHDHWNRLSDAEREARIRWALR